MFEKYSDVEEISSIEEEYQEIEKCLEEAEAKLKKLKEKIDEKIYTDYNSEIEKLKKRLRQTHKKSLLFHTGIRK